MIDTIYCNACEWSGIPTDADFDYVDQVHTYRCPICGSACDDGYDEDDDD